MFVEVPDSLKGEKIHTIELEEGWRDVRDYTKCQTSGNHWYEEGKVPSAVLPQAYKYVVNTLHPDYKETKLIQTTDLVPDERIEHILKQYASK